MKISKLAIIGILFLMVCNGVSAVWIYPNVDMVANNFTLNTITAQNYTSVTYGDTWIDLVEGGNITFAGNCTSSRSLIEQNGLCSLGNYTTDISIDMYAPSDWTVGSASITCISNNSEADTTVTSYSTSTVNATHQRVTFTYNPSNDFDIIDMGLFDANVSISVSNATLQYSGYNLTEDLFEVYNLASVGNITSSYNSTHNSINMSWNSVTQNTTTFRPNAAGSRAQCTPNGDATNWGCVDESTSDEDTTYNSDNTTAGKYDSFNIPDHTTEDGPIEKVTVFIRGKRVGGTVVDSGMAIYIKTGGGYYIGGSDWLTSSFATYSYTWETNPADDEVWEWADIDNLEIGYQIYSFTGEARLTQCYAVVDWYEYTEGTIAEADSFVVVRSNTSQPTCPTDGYEVQNNTDVFYNVSRTFTEAYFTVFTYNDTTRSYGTGVPMLWGGIQLQCFNESNPSQAINFDIEITNSDASEVYTASDVSNGQAISFDDIPYGTNTIFVISNSSYEQRIYYYTITVNHFYNFSFYLPPPETGPSGNTTEIELYYIQVINEYDQPVEDVLVNIKRYINTTDTYLNVSVLITDGNGYVSLYLLPDEHYKLFLTKTGYEDEISEFFPDPLFYGIYYPKIIKIYTSEGEYPVLTFSDCIVFTGVMHSNNTIRVYYNDNCEGTTSAEFTVYEEYNGSSTFVGTWSSSSDVITHWVTITNTSREHIIVLNLVHSDLGTIHNHTIYVMPLKQDKVDESWLNEQFTANLGVWDFSYVLFFIIWFPSIMIIILFGSIQHPGLGILGGGLWITFANWYINFSIVTTLVSIAGILIVLGVIVLINKKGRSVTS